MCLISPPYIFYGYCFLHVAIYVYLKLLQWWRILIKNVITRISGLKEMNNMCQVLVSARFSVL